MELKDVNTWEDYRHYMREKSPEAKAEMERLDRIVQAIVFASDSLNEFGMGLELYNLDEEEETEEVEETEKTLAVV